ncbi:MAG: hypothetical protein ACNA7M_14455, partial [Roseovarius sp.]
MRIFFMATGSIRSIRRHPSICVSSAVDVLIFRALGLQNSHAAQARQEIFAAHMPCPRKFAG